jgi:hypothetical protein
MRSPALLKVVVPLIEDVMTTDPPRHASEADRRSVQGQEGPMQVGVDSPLPLLRLQPVDR